MYSKPIFWKYFFYFHKHIYIKFQVLNLPPLLFAEFIPGFVEMARNRDAFEEQENEEQTNNENEY